MIRTNAPSQAEKSGGALRTLPTVELMIATAAARTAAHQSPLGEITKINKHGKPTGERFVTKYTNAWAHRANEWVELLNECQRRGIKSPQCNCSKDDTGLCVKG